jgi:predicted DNA-binding protein (MmcQ/YjbR family)
MDKRHWTSVAAGDGVSRLLVEELVKNAYLLVVDRLPRAKRAELLEDPHVRSLHDASSAPS